MISNHVADFDSASGIDENALKDQKEKVRRFRKRLQAREAFILPEVWDVISARVIGDAGFDIIGISPVSVAWSRGLLPADRVPLDTLVETAKSVASNFSVPVNADLEGVIGRTMEEIGRAVNAVVSAGCVGVTIGDGGRGGQHGMASMHDMTAAIKAAKAAALETRIPAVVTAPH